MDRCMSPIDDLLPRIVLDKAGYLFMLSSIFTNIYHDCRLMKMNRCLCH